MADPLTLAIAAAAAGKAVELTGQPVKDATVALWAKVRGRLRGRSDDEEVLDGAVADLDDNERIGRLAELLSRTMENDQGFADELRSAFQHAADLDPGFRAEVHQRLEQHQTNTTTSDEGVTNVFNGQAEKVIQLRDVHGGLTIN